MKKFVCLFLLLVVAAPAYAGLFEFKSYDYGLMQTADRIERLKSSSQAELGSHCKETRGVVCGEGHQVIEKGNVLLHFTEGQLYRATANGRIQWDNYFHKNRTAEIFGRSGATEGLLFVDEVELDDIRFVELRFLPPRGKASKSRWQNSAFWGRVAEAATNVYRREYSERVDMITFFEWIMEEPELREEIWRQVK